jgi:hypothetical protein
MDERVSHTGLGFYPAIGDDFGDGLSEDLRARVKSELEPDERILWAARGIPRPLGTIRVFPALFAAFLCATSGFALMVLFGIYGLRDMGPAEMIFLLCLPPAALGGMVAIGTSWSWVRHHLWQRLIARSLYVLTDRRAIVAWRRRRTDEVILDVWTTDAFNGTLCVEHGDGIGAVYFRRNGETLAPYSSFEGIRDAGRVDELIRQVLLGEKVLSGADFAEL